MFRTITILQLFIAVVFGNVLQAQCVSGDCVNGIGQYTFKNNSATYTGEFALGLPSGKGICNFQNGDVYDGAWKAGKFHGIGALTLIDGSVLNGEWLHGKFRGEKTEGVLSSVTPAKNIALQSGQRIWALVVGVSDYHHMPVLKYTDDDAYHFHNHLLAADGLAVPSSQVKLLINESATHEAIIRELNWLSAQADADDVILFYFSGHGLKGSFLPFDYDGFNNQLFHNEVNNLIKPSAAAHRICIADACHSGSLMAARDPNQQWLSNWYPMLMEEKSNLTFFLSSKSSERSLEAEGLRMGVFSHFLIKGLKGEADNDQNGLVTLGELYQYVQNQVDLYTGGQQHPLLAGEYDADLVLKYSK